MPLAYAYYWKWTSLSIHLDPSQISWVVMAQGLQHMFCGERIGAEAVQDGGLEATLAAELWVNVQGVVVAIQPAHK